MSLSRSLVFRRWLALLLAALCALRAVGADTDPETPVPVPPIPPVEAPAPPRMFDRDVALGLFQNVNLLANEMAEHVVAIFGDAEVDGRVRENAVLVFGDGRIRSEIPGNVVVVFGSAAVMQNVRGNVVAVFSDLTIGPDVTVRGNLVTVGSPSKIDPSARVRGQSVPVPIPGVHVLGTWVREDLPEGRLYAHNRRGTWVFIGVMLGLSLLAAVVFRGPVEAGVGVMARRPAAAFVNGLLGAILVPPAMFLLTATGIGALVVPFAWIGVMFATLIGVIALHRHCGAQLGFGSNAALALIVGHVLFAAVYMLPYIGFLAWGTVMMFGFGVALTAWGENRRERRAQETATRKAKAPPPAAPVPSTTASAPAPTPPAPVAPESGMSFQPQSQTPPSMRAHSIVATAEAVPEPVPAVETTPMPAAAPPPFRPTPPVIPRAATPPPTPAATMPLTAEPAEFWPRIAANLLDLIMVIVLVNVLDPLENFFLSVWFIYHIAFWAWRGTTLGGTVMNLRIQRLDGRRVDVGIALVRALGAVMSFLPLGLGFLWMNWDPEKQTWHDKIAGTVIVRLPRGQALI